MTARYAVIGNPVSHSRSPSIHAWFARQTGEDIEYGRLLAPVDGFVEAAARFRDEGGLGLNVTVPFKRAAYEWADRHSPRAAEAGAVNTLRFDADAATGRALVFGDNTDGVGLVRDLERRLGGALRGRKVLMVGAGGAACGAVGPLLDAGVERLAVCNRTHARAVGLVARFARREHAPQAVELAALRGDFDIVVNATSSSLQGEAPALDDAVLGGASLAYDMFYGREPTGFLRRARSAGCPLVCDGLGMLVEQAAESFFVWRGVRPQTKPVYEAVRKDLDAEAP